MSSRSFRIGRSVTGLGLFATKRIKRGVLSRLIAAGATPPRKPIGVRHAAPKYQFEINKQWTIDGSPRWNACRYIIFSLIQIGYRLQPALLFRRASSRQQLCRSHSTDQSERTYVSSLVRGFVRFRVEDDTFANVALRNRSKYSSRNSSVGAISGKVPFSVTVPVFKSASIASGT